MTKMYIQLSMDNELFEWDNEKNTINRQKHGIGFEEALLVFDDPLHIELYDAAHSDKEDRFLAIMMQSMTLSEAKSMLTQQRIEQLKTLAEQPIDTSDIPELTQEEFFKMYRPIKKPLSIRLDSDIIVWLKSYGKGYQSRINTILRNAMAAEKQAAQRR